MANDMNSKSKLISVTAGINTICLGLMQYCIEDDSLKGTLSTILPLIIGGIVYLIYWACAKLDIESAEQITATNKLNKKEKSLKKSIESNQKLGIDTSDLEDELRKTALAKAKVYDLKVLHSSPE